ncbi:MAG: YIP1 family protein [Bacteroidota bacterium]
MSDEIAAYPRELTTMERYSRLFVAPGSVFEAIRDLPPSRIHWLVPVLLYILTATVCVQIIVGQPGPAASLKELSEKEFLPVMEQYITDGTITRQQAESLMLFITPGTTQFFITQLFSSGIVSFMTLFVVGFMVWQLGRSVLGRNVEYKKVLEIIGLTFLIGILEQIVSTVLVVATGSVFASPSPGIFFLHDTESVLFPILSSINLFMLWQLWVVSSGLSWFFEREFPKVFVLVMALWLLWTMVTVAPVLMS